MFWRNGRFWTALLLIAALIALSAWTGRPQGVALGARGVLLRISAPPLAAIRAGGRWIEGAVGTLVSLKDLPAENRRLESELANLRRTRVQDEELRQENAHLRELLRLEGVPGSPAARGLAAAVIARDPARWYDQIVVNRGAADGVRRGMAVITPDGLVGRIAQAEAHQSVVLLLTNPDSGVGAMVQRATSRAQGVALGAAASRDTLHMQFFSRDADVVPGDIVITSGLGGQFPKGIAIGYVSSVSTAQRGLVLSAALQPAADLDRLEWVMIIP